MDQYVLETYLREAEGQAEFALNAVRALNNVVSALQRDEESQDDDQRRVTLNREVFRTIHSFLTHASNLSRLFWPIYRPPRQSETPEVFEERVPRAKRGRELRTVVGLPDNGHLLHDRRLRDHLEHFDERLDQWQVESKKRNYLQDHIGSVRSISGVDATDMMRWFDPSTSCFRFRGEEYDLQALTDAVNDLLQQIRTFLKKT